MPIDRQQIQTQVGTDNVELHVCAVAGRSRHGKGYAGGNSTQAAGEVSEDYTIYMNYVDLNTTDIVGVTVNTVNDTTLTPYEAKLVTLSGGEEAWMVKVPETTNMVSVTVQGKNQKQTIISGNTTGTNGQLTLTRSLTHGPESCWYHRVYCRDNH